MASLLKLPPELQTRILAQLIPTSIPSVQALLYTCKQLYEVALPLSVNTFWYPETSGNSGQQPRCRSRILQFLRYITVTKPELAECVKTIIVGGFSSHESLDDINLDKVGPEPETKAMLRGLIESVVTPDSVDDYEAARQEWLDDLDEGCEDAEVALLLLKCPRVEVFCYGEPFRPRNLIRLLDIARKTTGLADECQDRASSSPQVLSHLRELYQESTEPKYGYLVFNDAAVPAFQLPSLRSYECILTNGSDGCGGAFRKIPRRSSLVESITLRKSCASRGLMEAMLGACKALRSFEYTRGLYHMYDHEFMPRDLTQAILPFSQTLEYLYVNYEDDWEKGFWSEHPDRIPMGTELREMKALKTLVTGMQALTGLLDCQPAEVFGDEIPLEVEGAPALAECLPQNLEHLEIHGCGKAILPQAKELLEMVEAGDRFQSLRRVRFLFNAENIGRRDIQLPCSAPDLKLDIVL